MKKLTNPDQNSNKSQNTNQLLTTMFGIFYLARIWASFCILSSFA